MHAFLDKFSIGIGFCSAKSKTGIMENALRLTTLMALGLGCLGAASNPAALAQDATTSPILPSISHFTTGETLSLETGISFQTDWDRVVLATDEDGGETTISGTSYQLDCDCDLAARPVVFLFNGGPGASSSPLHFSLGPYARQREESGETNFTPNTNTVLDAADLVFIDPVETGFSRASSEEVSKAYLDVAGDAKAVSDFIHTWLSAHDRETSPVLIAGQSYGGFRLGNLLPHVGDLPVAGLIMVSPAIDSGISATDQGYVHTLPTMVATAWRFGKSAIEADSEKQAFELARDFAETDYLLALQQGADLPADEVERISKALSEMTGLKQAAIADADIRIPIQYFLENVLAEENLLVSRLNTGKTAPKAPPKLEGRPAAANDPSLGLGRSNKIISEDIGNYLKDLTGYTQEDGYRSLNLDANFAWNWNPGRRYSPYSTTIPMLEAFFEENAEPELLIVTGYRDLAIPTMTVEYTISHADLPQDRVEVLPMLGGHSPYDEPEIAPVFSSEIRDFILNSTSGDIAKEDNVHE